jgi:hypothetical protein
MAVRQSTGNAVSGVFCRLVTVTVFSPLLTKNHHQQVALILSTGVCFVYGAPNVHNHFYVMNDELKNCS